MPVANASGVSYDSFQFQVHDGTVYSVSAYTMTVDVTPVNDIPVVHADSFGVDNDSTLTVNAPGVLANDVDVDGDRLIVNLVTGPAHGTLNLVADGSFTYAPTASFVGTDTFVYIVSDGVALSSPSTVSMLVNGTIGPPPPNVEDPVITDSTDESPNEEDEDVLTLILSQPGSPTNNGNDDPTRPPRPIHHQSRTSNTPILLDPVAAASEPVEEVSSAGLIYPTTTNVQNTPSIAPAIRSEGHSPSTHFMFETGLLWNQLDSLVDDLENQDDFFELVAGTSIVVTGAMSAGLVLWAARASYFLTMLSTSLPAWAMIDPIPVLDAAALKRRTERRANRRYGNSLADIVGDQVVSVSP